MLSQSKNTTPKRNRLTEYARDSKEKSAFHYSIFQNSISPSIQVNSTFNCHNPKAHKFYYKIIILFPDLFIASLSLSDFRYHRYKHNFQDSLNLLGN